MVVNDPIINSKLRETKEVRSAQCIKEITDGIPLRPFGGLFGGPQFLFESTFDPVYARLSDRAVPSLRSSATLSRSRAPNAV